ncbi:PREDICTED: hemicentin-2-like [Dufourea novaeangliae]|uniref:Neural cell adhesion molecule 2 n=1 Tax=Dufourea novaeangliae TaxID=178035 RepID=A0A154P5Q3_DUFNO|nr:PREDICTED: hemicentin-2-like [Dufourea novaeangliae]KZC06460.1 Neural cell adhesion molecule 2 [Dufourea novaeangliae]
MRCTSGHVFLTSLLILLRARRANAAPEDSPEFQNKAPLKLVWASEGEDVELPCDITPPTPTDVVNMVLWFRDSDGIPLYSLDARSGDLSSAIHWAVSDDLGKRTYFQIGDGQRAKLKVTKVMYKDQGIFRCRVDFIDSPTRNFLVNLTLVEEPSKPVIYNAQGREVTGVGGPFLQGYNLALTCQVSGGRPRPSVTWWKDGEILDGVVDTVSIGAPSKFTVNHLFIDKVTRSLWGTKLECRAQSAPMSAPIVREVPLDIYLKPAVVKIILSEEQIYAGRPIAARCETWGSSPAARIVWRLGEQVIGEPNVSTTQRSNSTVSKLALALGKDDDGKELTCRAENPRFPGGNLEQTKVLSVAYAPVVAIHLATGYVLDTLREGDDLKLVCNVESNPLSTKVIWYHNGNRLEHDVATGTLIASNTLTLRILTLAHGGQYSCGAINSVGEGGSPPIFIRVKYAPRCRVGYERQEIAASRRETVSLRCEVDAIPTDVVRFSWTYNGTRGDVLPMQNSKARNNGLVSVLEYTPTADTDFGTLACWASNSIGRQRTPCIFNIVPGKAPQPPFDCSLQNETSSLEVNCVPGADGGSPQYFLLEVRGAPRNPRVVQVNAATLHAPQSDQGAVGEVPAIYQEKNMMPNFQLHDLEPGVDYTLYVYAVNGQGRSEPALLEHVSVVEPIGGRLERTGTGIFLDDLKKALPNANSENLIIVIALTGTGAVALILIGIGVIIGLAICRRRNGSPVKDGPDDFTTPTYVSAQRIEPRIRYSGDGRRSQRTSLYVEDSRNEPDLLQRVEIDMHN